MFLQFHAVSGKDSQKKTDDSITTHYASCQRLFVDTRTDYCSQLHNINVYKNMPDNITYHTLQLSTHLVLR